MKSEINKNGAKVRKKIHPLYLKLMNLVEDKTPILVNPEKLDEIKKNYFDKNIPVSFCANHTNSHDIPVAAKAVKEHFYVMIAKEGFNVPTVIMLNKNKESIKDHYVEDGFSNYIRKQNLEEDFDKVIKKYI